MSYSVNMINYLVVTTSFFLELPSPNAYPNIKATLLVLLRSKPLTIQTLFPLYRYFLKARVTL